MDFVYATKREYRKGKCRVLENYPFPFTLEKGVTNRGDNNS